MDNNKDSDDINFLEKSIEHLTIINEIPNNESLKVSINIQNEMIYHNLRKYLPLDDPIFEAFQVIDPCFRFKENSLKLYRYRLLNKFVRCYNFSEYKTPIEQYTNFTKTKSEDLHLE